MPEMCPDLTAVEASGREVAPTVHHDKHGLDGGADEMRRKYKAGNVHAYAAFSIVGFTDPILLKLLFARRIPPKRFPESDQGKGLGRSGSTFWGDQLHVGDDRKA